MRALVAALSLLVFAACGGSSSETPPPLEPDPEALAGRKPAESAPAAQPPAPPTSSEQSDAETSPFEIEPRYPGSTDPEPRRKRPVRTWGGNRPKPAPELAPPP